MLTTIDRQQQVLLAFVANQQQRQQAEAAAAHQRELDQLKLDAANSGVYLSPHLAETLNWARKFRW